MVQYTLHFVHSYNINIFRCKLSIRIVSSFSRFILDVARWKQQVAFTAVIPSSSKTWNSGACQGLGYNRTGDFTVPVPNTYVFYASAVENERQELELDIILNSVWKVRLICNDKVAYQTNKPGCFTLKKTKSGSDFSFCKMVFFSLAVFPWSFTMGS